MNFNILGIVLFATGAVLIYSGVKDRDPRAVVREALRGQSNPGASGSGKAPAPRTAPSPTQPDTVPAGYVLSV